MIEVMDNDIVVLEHAEQVSYQHIFLIETFATNHWK